MDKKTDMKDEFIENLIEELYEFKNEYSDKYIAKSNNEILSYRNHSHQADLRQEFQRDRDRIIHSRAFRRLSGKTQVFNANKGDHYRTRLTHSLEVSQISRTIGKSLGLDEDLIEAIALGHDLGHTPFGHIIERTLHDIIKNEELGNIKVKITGGFKHNFQSIHLIDNIEMGNGNGRGLNLTLAVRDGIIKHTGFEIKSNFHEKKETVKYETLNLEAGDIYIMDYNHAITLEGQIVALADEIAQSTHDLEDGIRSKIIDIKKLSTELAEKIEEIKKDIENSISRGEYNTDHALNVFLKLDTEIKELSGDLSQRTGKLIRILINVFIIDALKNIMNILKKDKFKSINKDGIVMQKLVENSKYIKELRKFISYYIYRHVVSSQEVAQLDSKAKYLIKQIFKAYYEDPRQLPDYTLNRYFNKKGKKLDRTIIEKNSKDLKSDPEFIRVICDHISGMTDMYAIQEYNKLYGTHYNI